MKKEITITGMKCSGCEQHVEEELLKIKGVEKVKATKDKNLATVECDEKVSDNNLLDAINKNTNFKAIEVKTY